MTVMPHELLEPNVEDPWTEEPTAACPWLANFSPKL